MKITEPQGMARQCQILNEVKDMKSGFSSFDFSVEEGSQICDMAADCSRVSGGNTSVPTLIEGMVVRNYREMCKLLGERERTGGARVNQLERWSKWFCYEKSGHSFRIIKVYDKTFGRDKAESVWRGKAGKYSQYIEPILLDCLCKDSGDEVGLSFTKKDLFFSLGLVNEYYPSVENLDYSREVEKSSKRFSEREIEIKGGSILVDSKQYYYFQNIVSKKLNSVVNSGLESMLKEGLIRISDEYSIKPQGGKSFVADLNQEMIISKVRERVLAEMNLSDFKSVVICGKLRTFYKKFNDIITEEQKWSAVYRRTRISLAIKKDEAKKIIETNSLEEFDRNKYRKRLNHEIAEYFRENITERKKRSEESGMENNSDKPSYWLDKLSGKVMDDEKFVDTQMSFIRYFIEIS